MSNHWKELLPVDRYQVRANGIMHEFYRKTLTTLYQPLIGSIAYSLYMTLWSQIDSERDWSKPSTHRGLMNVVQLDLKEILAGRKKLEGIGLLKTFVNADSEPRDYFYLLEAPLSPRHFFNDGVLNVYLYNRLGHYHFQQLKKEFTASELTNESDYQQVTAAFNDVFESLHPSEMAVKKASEMEQAMKLESGNDYIDESEGTSIRISNDFDIDWLKKSVSDLIVPDEVFTEIIIEAIKKLAYIYKLEPLQMKQIVETTYLKHNDLTVEALRKGTHEWYALQHNNQLPHLSIRVQPPLYREHVKNKPETEEDKAAQLFETISPYEQLEKIAGGAKPAESDIKIVESLMFDQKLLPGVVNVLIEYVMRTNDMKLPRAYVVKIGAHWARKNIKTVKEAMALARAEHQKYQEWSSQNKQRKTSTSKRNERKDTLPKWMTDEYKTQKQQPANFEQKKKQLEARLKKKYKEK